MFAFKKGAYCPKKRELIWDFFKVAFFFSKGGIMKNNYKGILKKIKQKN